MLAARERETAFIDPGVSDLPSLLAGLRPEIDAIILDSRKSAFAQIAVDLQSRPGSKTVHVIGHGREGEVSFQSGAVSLETLHEHFADLAEIGDLIGDDGELLFWSCHTGQGVRGSAFVEALAHASGTRVAASTGLVGSAARGGRWDLDARFDDREIRVPLTFEGVRTYLGVMHLYWKGSSSADAQSGTYGTTIGLDPISTQYYTTLTISGIPVGATLSDGTHSFTATTGHTSVNIASWNYTTSGSDRVWSTLTISNVPNDANFTLTATNSNSQTNTDAIAVLPAAPTIVSVTDNVGTVTGPLNNGGFTDDSVLVVRVSLANTGATSGDTIGLYNGASTLSSSHTLTSTDITNGYYDISTNTLSNSTTYNITARLTNGLDGHATSGAFTVTEDTTPPTETYPASRQTDNWTTANPEGAGNLIFGTSHGNAISVSDNVTDNLTVTISVGSGTFTLSGLSGLTFDSGANGGSAMTFTGTAAAINAALNNSIYHTTSTNTASNNTDDTLSITTTDAAGNSTTHSINFDVICFMAGTLIRTPNGDVKVETLKPGDLVLTSDGQIKPVSWLGRQTVSTVFADKLRVLPIRIKTGALAENVPSNDLLISPDHAVLVDGALIQAGALINGTSIVRETTVPKVFIYYHVEVADHSLILAENTPAETFVDNIDRLHFDNWAEHKALYPDGKVIDELPYPRAKAHRQVPVAIRVRLAERAQAIGAVADVAAA